MYSETAARGPSALTAWTAWTSWTAYRHANRAWHRSRQSTYSAASLLACTLVVMRRGLENVLGRGAETTRARGRLQTTAASPACAKVERARHSKTERSE
eukprot:955181-Pleurochrysis_carterae.AAC.2